MCTGINQYLLMLESLLKYSHLVTLLTCFYIKFLNFNYKMCTRIYQYLLIVDSLLKYLHLVAYLFL